jgi:hypothetical protein
LPRHFTGRVQPRSHACVIAKGRWGFRTHTRACVKDVAGSERTTSGRSGRFRRIAAVTL